jgi:DNA repair protein RecN (Recombination protein N)
MLLNLLIKNYALIEQLELSPDAQLNIITGETGAGKSIMLGAIGLLLGNRADTKSLYNPDLKCVIEGTFDVSGYRIEYLFEEEELDYSPTCLVRREISPSGKSRAFVNDTPVNLDSLRRVTSQLMDVHSQHDTLLLGSNEFQLQIVDTYSQNDEILKKYHHSYKNYRQAKQNYEKLKSEATQMRKEFDYNQFLYDELHKAQLQANEQEQLEQELVILENATEVKEKLQLASEYLNNAEQSVLVYLKSASANLNNISKLSPQYEQLRQRIQSSYIELKDLADEVDYEQDKVEIDDERAEKIRQRLNVFYQLQTKHQAKTNAELILIRDDLEQKVSKVLNLDDALTKAKTEVDKNKTALTKSADKLTASRKMVLPQIEKAIKHYLLDLGIPNAEMLIQHQTIEPSADGTDNIDFLFTANKGIKPQPLKNVASGGEFSRLMMVIKYILASKRHLPTIVFDEIDTGVSGEIAIKMGNMMLDMARSHQIIAISHLPQIASQGTAHYFVYKDNTTAKTMSRIKRLSYEERVTEIAQMIGGKKPSEAIVQEVRDLLSQQLAQNSKVQTKLF